MSDAAELFIPGLLRFWKLTEKICPTSLEFYLFLDIDDIQLATTFYSEVDCF